MTEMVALPERNRSFAAPSFSSEDELEREVKASIDGDGPIIVGPWLSELGYELLYWIPFLTWLTEAFGIDRNRLVALSRGGVASWYGNLTTRYFDIFEIASETEYREANEVRQLRQDNSIKQFHLDDFDRFLVEKICERVGVGRCGILHPYLMYRTLNPYWAGLRTNAFAKSHLKFARIAAPDHKLCETLPARYVAAKFYTRASFPANDENVGLVASYLERLSAHLPVVILDHPFLLDDHGNFPKHNSGNVIYIGDRLTLADNLAAQTAVIARSEMVVGTYGGFTYLPLLLGRPAVGLISHANHLLSAHSGILFTMAEALSGSVSLLEIGALRSLKEV